MARPTILATSYSALRERTRKLQKVVGELKASIDLAERSHDSLINQGVDPETIETLMVNIQDQFTNDYGDELKSMIDTMPWDYNREFRAGFFVQNLTDQRLEGPALSVDIDIDNGASKAELTVNTAGFFDAFDAADIINLSNAEDGNHNVSRTIDTRVGDVITLTTVLPGADNAADTQIIISISERP